MTRIAKKFSELKRRKRKALIVYMTAGDPSLKKNAQLLRAFEKDGVDLVELGVPFSDPLADGPVIQAASQRSLKKGTTLAQILQLVKTARRDVSIPILLMSYLNPILSYGLEAFARDSSRSGVDGIIVPDLPPDEAHAVRKALRKSGVDLVFLLAPTSGPERRRLVSRASRGFIYYVSLTGVTGMRSSIPPDIRRNIQAVKKVTSLPVCAGFGVSTPQQAKRIAACADGVIVGSAVVRALDTHRSLGAAEFSKKFIRPFARALQP